MVKATHALLSAHVAVFLVLVFGAGAPWQEALIERLALGDAAGVLAQPWTLLTHVFLNVHPLEFALGTAILALAGGSLEERLGRARLCGLYFGTAALVALGHLVLLQAGLSRGILSGTLGASCGLLSAYLFVRGSGRRVGTLPFPLFYLLICFGVLVGVWAIQQSRTAELALRSQELVTIAHGALSRSFDERLADLQRAARLDALRPATWGHLLGLSLGAISLYLVQISERIRERVRVLREIQSLQTEVDARARVELLLSKISSHGIDALTRPERRFLRYASRFYRQERAREAARSGV